MIGNIINGAGSVLSGIFSGVASRNREKRALSAQKGLMALQNYYNRSMYNQQRKDNREDAARAAWQNSIAYQKQQLEANGLNADLVYGGGAGNLQTGQMAAPASAAPSAGYDPAGVIMNTPTSAQSVMAGISAMRQLAETRNINADTSKKQGELTSISLDNFTKAATQGNAIELEGLKVQLSKSALSLSATEKDKMVAEISNLQTQNELINQQVSESMARASNLDSTTLLNRISAYYASDRFAMEVRTFQQNLRESDARINLTSAQAKEILTLLTCKKLNLSADTFFKTKQARLAAEKTYTELFTQNNLQIQGRQMEFTYSQDQKFDSWYRTALIANFGLGAVGNIAGAVTKVGPLMKSLPKIGFTK